MRVRIVRAPKGVVDGVNLSCFRTGETYDLPASLATMLVALDWADIDRRLSIQRRGRVRGIRKDRRRHG